MQQESRVSEREHSERVGVGDLENALIQQALDLLMENSRSPRVMPDLSKLAPELDAKCIALIPEEACRCVMLIPQDGTLPFCPEQKATRRSRLQ